MNYVIKPTENDIQHHGILGQKWGKRQGPPYPLDGSDHSAAEKKAGWKKSLDGKNALSIKAGAHKALAKVYSINEKTYAKSNKTLSSMNRAAKEAQLKKAAAAQKEANIKRDSKISEKKRYSQVDPDLAKNKQTRRVALDYHNLSDSKFKAKYKSSKDKFAKRYTKTKGDTYSLGKRKAAVALAIIGSLPAKSVYIGKGRRLQVTGKAAVAKSLAYDLGSTALNTNLGYKAAEKKYYENVKK